MNHYRSLYVHNVLENDYRVNLKAELEIRHLHSKLDLLLTHQWQRLLEIQQVQTDLLEELGNER